MPPPSAGGVMLAETLHMHGKADLSALGYGSGAYLHLLAETMRGANADRMRGIGDPAFIRMDVDAIASPARMKARRAHISLDATRRTESFRLDDQGTHTIVVVGEDDDIAAVTTSVRSLFGSQLITSGGFVLNDALLDFDHPRLQFRFSPRVPPNAARGGARPVASMAPTIVVGHGGPVLALGASGGTRGATAVTQALLARLAFNRSPRETVADARIDVPPTGGLFLEPGADPALVADLRRRGEVVIADQPNYSALGLISIREGGARKLEAVADPRKGGVGLVR
jgi:gamma-glutamyltranspeptidase/glutathione hydrolase